MTNLLTEFYHNRANDRYLLLVVLQSGNQESELSPLLRSDTMTRPSITMNDRHLMMVDLGHAATSTVERHEARVCKSGRLSVLVGLSVLDLLRECLYRLEFRSVAYCACTIVLYGACTLDKLEARQGQHSETGPSFNHSEIDTDIRPVLLISRVSEH